MNCTLQTSEDSSSAGLSDVFIALGSNVGDRLATIRSAIDELAATPGIEVVRVSRIIETEPVGPPGQGPYLNAALHIRTTLPPREVLCRCLEIEAAHGRNRGASTRWGPRTLDLDLLLFGDQIIDEPGLHVPHPRLTERPFVLVPLAEIAGSRVHPQTGFSIQSLLDRLAVRA